MYDVVLICIWKLYADGVMLNKKELQATFIVVLKYFMWVVYVSSPKHEHSLIITAIPNMYDILFLKTHLF